MKLKHRCLVMGCKKLAKIDCSDKEMKLYFCKWHNPSSRKYNMKDVELTLKNHNKIKFLKD